MLSATLISTDPAAAVAQPARTALGALLVFLTIMAIALIPAAAFPSWCCRARPRCSPSSSRGAGRAVSSSASLSPALESAPACP